MVNEAPRALKLIIMRHAEAVPDSGGVDHERSLSARGFLEARSTPAKLAAMGWVPDWILSSDAVRTRQTAECLITVWGAAKAAAVKYSRHLYLAGVETVADNVEALEAATIADAPFTVLLILGHNPGLSEAAGLWCDRALNLSPGAAALMSIEADSWAEAMAFLGGWKFEGLITP